MRDLDKAETSKIVVLRSAVTAALMASAAIVAAFSYILLTANETKLNNSMYESIADHMLRVISEDFHNKDSEILTTAKSMAYNHPNNYSWPEVHISGFYDISRAQVEQSGLHQLMFLPIVPPSQLADYELYMKTYFQSESAVEVVAGQHPFGFGVYATDANNDPYHDTTGKAVLYNSKYQIITPVLQEMHDEAATEEISLSFNAHSEKSIGRAIDAVIDCTMKYNYTIASTNCGRVSACIIPYRQGMNPMHHLTAIVQPIMLDQNTENLVGFVAGTVNWQHLIARSTPERVDGVDIVIHYGEVAFTYYVTGKTVTVKASRDVHDSRYDSYARRTFVYSNDLGHAHRAASDDWMGGHYDAIDSYHYTVTLYPTAHFFHGNYSTRTPLYVSIASGALIVFCSMIFFSYDVLVSRASSRKNAVLDTKRRFVRFISHEIRTPLNSVHLGLEALHDELNRLAGLARPSGDSPLSPALLLEKLGTALDSWLELAAEMMGNSETAVDVLNDLLNYDKIEMGTLRLECSSVPIWQVVEKCTQTFQMQARQKVVDLTLHGACWDAPLRNDAAHVAKFKEFHVVGDSSRLAQVLRNLISNALKFTPSRGGVIVSAEWSPAGLPDAQLPALSPELAALVHRPRAGSICIAVTDSGAGLSPEQLSQICSEGVQFNANQLQAGQGSGLGLFISKGLVELHGGRLTVTSEGLGKGATFTVELPLFDASTQHDTPEMTPRCGDADIADIELGLAEENHQLTPALPDATALSERAATPVSCAVTPAVRKVLVVDDAPSNRKMLIRLLSTKGFVCEQAEDGQRAVDVYNAHISRGDAFDAVVMDYEMPVMNGPTAAKKLRELGCTCLIVGVTGNLLPEDVTYYKNQGANAVLGKPLNMALFEDLIGGFKC